MGTCCPTRKAFSAVKPLGVVLCSSFNEKLPSSADKLPLLRYPRSLAAARPAVAFCIYFIFPSPLGPIFPFSDLYFSSWTSVNQTRSINYPKKTHHRSSENSTFSPLLTAFSKNASILFAWSLEGDKNKAIMMWQTEHQALGCCH